VSKNLPSRPNLDHLRRQAKTLLARLADGDRAAAQTLIDHLPAARKLSPARVRAAQFRLADAQSAIARKSGFAAWPALARHVADLRALEGEWTFVSLEIDGTAMPAGVLAASRLLIDGDRFRTESPEAIYDGVFTIDVEASPNRIDLEFVEGPEAGNWSYGLYDLDGDDLTLCLGLTGAARPSEFITTPGSGHALERLRRASASRPAGVTGGKRAARPKLPPSAESPRVDAASFDARMTPLLEKLQGTWAALALDVDGKPMPAEWLAYGARTMEGNETKVVFGGQVMLHAKMRVDETATPIAVDYLNLAGAHKGRVSLGIMEWSGDECRFLMAAPGQPRPTTFAPGAGLTLSRWRRKQLRA